MVMQMMKKRKKRREFIYLFNLYNDFHSLLSDIYLADNNFVNLIVLTCLIKSVFYIFNFKPLLL